MLLGPKLALSGSQHTIHRRANMLAAASFFCRASGFSAVAFLPQRPEILAALKAAPSCVMISIVAQVLLLGGLAEWLGAGAAAALMRWTGRDLTAAFSGVATVTADRATAAGLA